MRAADRANMRASAFLFEYEQRLIAWAVLALVLVILGSLIRSTP